MTERAPEPGGLDEQLEADLALECLVAGRGLIADTASAMSPLMWNAAVPAGQYPEHSWPRIVRHGKAAPARPS